MSNYLFKKIDFLVKSPLDGEGVCGWVVCVGVGVAHISIVKTKKLRFFRIFEKFFHWNKGLRALPSEVLEGLQVCRFKEANLCG